ncbi:MAG: CpsD/CapB family tyrosine-protein kinase [Gemmatimonadetes bacterium]|nr:CpsD/CapB family tyrosine-protein kinase [Gemmatimonadota bacterium]
MSKIYEALNRARDDDDDPKKPKPPAGKRAGSGSGSGSGTRGGFDPRILSEELQKVAVDYEALHSSMEKTLSTVAGHAIMMVSSVEEEGTTTVAAEYASTLGRGIPRGTLLIDANFRNPTLHDVFDVPNDTGFADVLQDRATLKQAVQTLAEGELYLLTAGLVDFSPSARISGSVVSRFLAEAKAQYGAVVLDGPPVIPYPEAVHIASAADGVVFIIESERTKREIVARAKDALDAVDANILGVVLNRRRYVIPEFLYRQL